MALVVIAILSGAAMFASGFTLGLQQALAPGTPSNERELFDPFWEAYRKITTEYVGQVEPKQLVEGAIKGMFGAVDDPYSSYMTDEEYQNSLGGISGEFEGIGAQMTTRDGRRQRLRHAQRRPAPCWWWTSSAIRPPRRPGCSRTTR